MREAGAIATTGLTALQGIDDVLQIKRGESIAIVGASGGAGTLALQFAKLRGARVLGMASGADGVELVESSAPTPPSTDGTHFRTSRRTVSMRCSLSPAMTHWTA